MCPRLQLSEDGNRRGRGQQAQDEKAGACPRRVQPVPVPGRPAVAAEAERAAFAGTRRRALDVPRLHGQRGRGAQGWGCWARSLSSSSWRRESLVAIPWLSVSTFSIFFVAASVGASGWAPVARWSLSHGHPERPALCSARGRTEPWPKHTLRVAATSQAVSPLTLFSTGHQRGRLWR